MFKGGMGMNGMQGMLKKVQKMQSEMLKLQMNSRNAPWKPRQAGRQSRLL